MSRLGTISVVFVLAMALAPVAAADSPQTRVPKGGWRPTWTQLQAPAPTVQVTCTFLEVAASKGKTAMDPRLKAIERKLTRGPFKTWSEFKLLSDVQRTLSKKKTEAVALKQGAATGTLVEIVDKSKARLTLTVDNAKGKRVVDTTVTVDAADYVILTNELPNGDGHLVAVTCK